MRQATAEEVKRLAEHEMAIFDSLDVRIQQLVANHPTGIYLLGVFQRNPNAYEFAKQHPMIFAEKLRDMMDSIERDTAAAAKRAVMDMIRGLKK